MSSDASSPGRARSSAAAALSGSCSLTGVHPCVPDQFTIASESPGSPESPLDLNLS